MWQVVRGVWGAVNSVHGCQGVVHAGEWNVGTQMADLKLLETPDDISRRFETAWDKRSEHISMK